MRTIQWGVIVCACIFLFGCTTGTTGNPAVDATAGNHRLAPCPKTPNCVSSLQPNDPHYVPPLRYTGDRDAAFRKLVALITSYPRARIVAKEANDLRVEFRSAIFRFVDDTTFFFSADQPVIHVRSASRVGYSDFGVNRRRVEDIRKRWNKELLD